MLIDVVQLPRDLSAAHVDGRTVVVFDVLRATTTMTAALAAGVREIFVQPDIASVLTAAEQFGPDAITCGERDCLPPAGFTLGNSPAGFTPAMVGRTAFMATTNGTKAIVAARGAKHLFVGALVNATAVAQAVAAVGNDVTLLCSGSDGLVSLEDLIGAGAVLKALSALKPVVLASDVALAAGDLFHHARPDLPAALVRTRGGTNIIRNGLQDDIEFAARLDVFDIVGKVEPDRLRIARHVAG
ncbi:MAG TPA: 2-phosphosulfolactate phosphatase [Tepidisphaeraceae bacterium]|jgi:2-phosphosulfolactate phosphatase|nr:2-phosphosulfolactate phosphatase [Tepidisphaeraceae bacterium]